MAGLGIEGGRDDGGSLLDERCEIAALLDIHERAAVRGQCDRDAARIASSIEQLELRAVEQQPRMFLDRESGFRWHCCTIADSVSK